MEQRILVSTKKVLGLPEDHTEFDHDVLMFINSSFSTLDQVGLDFISAIEDVTAEWSTISDDHILVGHLQQYVFLNVRLLFDPPTTSYLKDAYEKQRDESLWRINTYLENTIWKDPEAETDEEA